MASQLKNMLGLLLALLMIVGVYAIVTFADSYSQSIDPTALRSFQVTAKGEVVAIPDIGRFTVSVITEGGDGLGVLQEEHNTKATAVIDFLRDQGVEKEDIKTTSYTVEPRYRYDSVPRFGGSINPPEIVGYTIRQSTRVTVRSLSASGSLLAGSVDAGANAVSQLSFEVDDLDAVQNEARGAAIVKAKEKAEVLADAGGFRLGKIISIFEGNSFAPQPYFFDAVRAEAGGVNITAAAIEPGSQDISISVTVVYEIR